MKLKICNTFYSMLFPTLFTAHNILKVWISVKIIKSDITPAGHMVGIIGYLIRLFR